MCKPLCEGRLRMRDLYYYYNSCSDRSVPGKAALACTERTSVFLYGPNPTGECIIWCRTGGYPKLMCTSASHLHSFGSRLPQPISLYINTRSGELGMVLPQLDCGKMGRWGLSTKTSRLASGGLSPRRRRSTPASIAPRMTGRV